jgi:uncharacterized phosphosugar-binding protein
MGRINIVSAQIYLSRVAEIIAEIQSKQMGNLQKAGAAITESSISGGRAYLFGSGHSVLPVLDVFPRYGSYVGFYPIYDPRLMWFNVIGPGGARELLWLERQEGYAAVILASYVLEPRDSILIFSHGGLNAVPVEVAIEAKKKRLTVISITSHQNYRQSHSTHSSGKKLVDASDISIDNCVPPEDALVRADDAQETFAAASTVAAVSIAMALVAEVGNRLVQSGRKPLTFVSPNVGLAADHNERVFVEYARSLSTRTP